jgi:hypothetical protein
MSNQPQKALTAQGTTFRRLVLSFPSVCLVVSAPKRCMRRQGQTIISTEQDFSSENFSLQLSRQPELFFPTKNSKQSIKYPINFGGSSARF